MLILAILIVEWIQREIFYVGSRIRNATFEENDYVAESDILKKYKVFLNIDNLVTYNIYGANL